MSDDTLFIEYIDAMDRGEIPDLNALCERADNPGELRQSIEFHGSIGTRIGRFRVVEQIGKGGFGSVFLAHDPELGRRVAIKVMAGKDWARNEARSLARLRHPNIVEVFEIEDDYVVMEYIDGKSLTPTGPPQERLTTLIQLADAVAYSHKEGVLSRDIKPDNVLIDEKGNVKLIDFSIAHVEGDDTDLNITQSLVASPAYLAPEQIETEQTGASPATDQFSLGVLAYEYLTGTHPFRKVGSSRKQVLDAIALCAPVRPPGLARDLQNVLLKALEPEPKRRYESVDVFRDDLQAVLELRPVSVSKANPVRFMRRHKRLMALAVVLVLALTVPMIVQRIARLNALRTMPLETPFEVTSALSELQVLPDEEMSRRIQARLMEVPIDTEWAFPAWRFRIMTGIETKVKLGRVYAPEGAVFEQQVKPGVWEPIEFASDSPLGVGFFRSNGLEFRKVRLWDTPVHIGEPTVDKTGATLVNGILATDVLRNPDGTLVAMTLDEAMAYARKLGGRIPTAAELYQLKIREGPTIGEWITDFVPKSLVTDDSALGTFDVDYSYEYELAAIAIDAGQEYPGLQELAMGNLVGINNDYGIPGSEGTVTPSVCFRIVFTTEE